jgi:hypothetical protein
VARFLPIVLFAAALASAQDDATRKASDFPAHASWPQFDIGAEYLVHSIPTEVGSIFARDYLVVEVAIYPRKQPVAISSAAFTLRVNGQRTVLYPESPGFVAASLKYPDWEQRPTLVGSVGVGDGSVIVGAPVPVGRFPGDPTGNPRVNLPRKQPDDTEAEGHPKQKVSVEDLVTRAALPEGEARVPTKGSLYFAFTGKLKSIHSLELLYEDTHGNKGSLKVLPAGTP